MTSGKSRQDQLKMIALITLLDAVTSQIYIDYLVSGFRVSVSVIILPVIYYYYNKINPIITSIFIGTFGLLFRGAIGAQLYGNFQNAVIMDYQIFIFDVTYGLLFYLLFYKMKDKSFLKWFFVVWVCDFTANLIEMTLRIGPLLSNSTEIINRLISVGFFRTLIACILSICFEVLSISFSERS